MRIAAIPIAAADLGSDGGVIDGCARVHWRGRAMFPAAGDGSGTFVFRRHLRRSLHVLSGKVRFSGAVPLVGFYPVAGGGGCTTRRAADLVPSMEGEGQGPPRRASKLPPPSHGFVWSASSQNAGTSRPLRLDEIEPYFLLPQ